MPRLKQYRQASIPRGILPAVGIAVVGALHWQHLIKRLEAVLPGTGFAAAKVTPQCAQEISMPAETTTRSSSADALEGATSMLRSFFEWFGEVGFFCGRVFRAAITPPYELRELIRQFDEVGSKSALLVVIAGAAM